MRVQGIHTHPPWEKSFYWNVETDSGAFQGCFFAAYQPGFFGVSQWLLRMGAAPLLLLFPLWTAEERVLTQEIQQEHTDRHTDRHTHTNTHTQTHRSKCLSTNTHIWIHTHAGARVKALAVHAQMRETKSSFGKLSPAACCSALTCVAVCCSILQYADTRHNTTTQFWQDIACSVLQRVELCCSVLQCVAVCRCGKDTTTEFWRVISCVLQAAGLDWLAAVWVALLAIYVPFVSWKQYQPCWAGTGRHREYAHAEYCTHKKNFSKTWLPPP